VPSLPRIKRTRPRTQAGDVQPRPEPRLQELHAHGLTWIILDAPTLEETDPARRALRLAPARPRGRAVAPAAPKVDEYPGLPVRDPPLPGLRQGDPAPERAELDFFVGNGYLVTLPKVELLPVTRLFARCQEDRELREQLFTKGSGYLLYHILDDLFDYCFPILDKIGHKLDSVEDDMFEERAEDVVRDLSNVKQEIISYRKIIKPERSTLRVLERQIERFLPEDLELYFDDIVDASERIWDLLDNFKEVVEALEDTNESVISHRQNDVLRVLTVVTVILLPLTLITGIFGMNVHFPGFETATAFWAIAGFMLGLGIGLTAFFRYKRWL
jgi:magnesium transporter